MPKLRFALIGVGSNVYGMHKYAHDLEPVEIAAVCDIREEPAQEIAAVYDCPYYLDYRKMIDETKPDVVVVMAPHSLHKEMTVYGLQAGAHVLCEKPMALDVQDADAMITAARETGKLLAINFQHRLRGDIIAAREIIQNGELGRIQHVDMKNTWLRTNIYYKSSDWKGRWNGEGGALLMNQSPHDLDLICFLMGMPSSVYAWTPTVLHSINAEDTAQAMLRWENGAMGTFHSSTAETGQDQRFEIIGTKGHLSIKQGGQPVLRRFGTDVAEFIQTSDQAFGSPVIEETIVETSDSQGNHRAVYENFCNAILNGGPISADGPTSIRGLELANAMIYSSHTGAPVEFPLNREKYADLLAELQAKEAANV